LRRCAGNYSHRRIKPPAVIASEVRRSSAVGGIETWSVSGPTVALIQAVVTPQAVELDCRVGFASSQ